MEFIFQQKNRDKKKKNQLHVLFTILPDMFLRSIVMTSFPFRMCLALINGTLTTNRSNSCPCLKVSGRPTCTLSRAREKGKQRARDRDSGTLE